MKKRWFLPAVLCGLLAVDCSSSHSAASSREAGVSTPPSCSAAGTGLSTCGGGGGSCCDSAVVPSGEYFRSYDGLSTNGATKDYPASISSVSVDTYEVTVARFRAFVSAEVAGWSPAAGSGKHAYLPAGGLNGGAETGWDAAWTNELPTTTADWSHDLACDASLATWSASAGDGDDHPINCVDWYEAYAFCIWDGGFLPTEAEWNYVAAGGSDQRLYPWSAVFPPGSDTLDCAHANYSVSWPGMACVSGGTTRVGAESPLGDGKWGHADLAGNVFEWALDWYSSSYTSSCDDCADLTAGQYRVIRGGSFDGASACLLNSLRETSVPDDRSSGIGFRCARPPG